jgi:hypothetical protein
MIVKNESYCRYKKCPGLNIKKQTVRTYQTKYRREECSIEKGSDFWLCNTVKNIDKQPKKIECHMRYHAEIESTIMSSTECSVISDLTEE